MKRKAKTGCYKLVTGIFLLFFIVCILSTVAISDDKNAENIENTRETISKWVQTRGNISQEKRDFELKKEMLNERIELVKREIESLQGKIKGAEESIAEADKKRTEMIEENGKLKQASAVLADIATSLEDRLRQLLSRLPDPIRQRVKPLSQRLPDKTKEVKLSLSERFQNVVGILNEIDKFNREISTTSEVRSVADGSSVEVTALYIGIGYGYYASADGKYAGIGTVSDQGWIWKQANEAAPQIADAIAILKNEKVATFVQLPVEIK
jgi:septal ring factor EnvC (AmiA/AmiB activator)